MSPDDTDARKEDFARELIKQLDVLSFLEDLAARCRQLYDWIADAVVEPYEPSPEIDAAIRAAYAARAAEEKK